MEIYRSTADVIVPDMETPEAEADYILSGGGFRIRTNGDDRKS
jgi:hypothetical protein